MALGGLVSPSSLQHPSFVSLYLTLPHCTVGGPKGGAVAAVVTDSEGVFGKVVASVGGVIGHVAPPGESVGT